MGMRATLDPLGGPATLVDKMIGNAFETVAAVARHLREIKYLSMNMDAVVFAAQTMLTTNPERVAMVTGSTGALGATVSIPLPGGVSIENIRSSSVLIASTDGDLYGIESGMFSATIQGESASLKFNLSSAAPDVLANAPIRWRLAYEV